MKFNILINILLYNSRSVWIASFFTTLYMAFVGALALVMYAYYSTCDPVANGRIEKSDQVKYNDRQDGAQRVATIWVEIKGYKEHRAK